MDNKYVSNLTWKSWSLLLLIGLLSITIRCGFSHEVECPVGWQEFDNFCYRRELWEIQATYEEARDACVAKGAALTSINNQLEQDFINDNYPGVWVWIGLDDLTTEGTYEWVDGQPYDYTNWRDTQPDNDRGIEHCIYLYEDGDWNDMPCDEPRGYICKMKRTHFWIESAQYTAKEGSMLSVTVHRDGLIANDDQISLTTPGVADMTETADLGTDYDAAIDVPPMPTATTFTLDFPPGESTATATYPINSDMLIEDMEYFTLTLALSGATAAGNVYGVYATVDSPSVSTVYIVDCTAMFWIEEAIYSTKENTALVVTIHRVGNLANDDDLILTANDGTAGYGVDYTSLSNDVEEPVEFDPGETTTTVTYTINKDVFAEGIETFTLDLTLTGATLSDMSATVISPSSSTVYIEDCTAIFWIDEFQYAVKENNIVVITIHRAGNLANTDEITLTVNGGSATFSTTDDTDDYTSETNTAAVTADFTPGETTATVTYTINKDALIEDLETFTLVLTLSGGTDTTFAAVGSPSTATVYIIDCTSCFWIEDKQCIAFEGTDLEVTFHRGGYLGREDSIPVSYTDARAVDPADYSPMDTDDVTFPEGATTSTKTITIVPDNMLEYNEMFNIEISIPEGTPLAQMATVCSPSMSEVIIKDSTWYVLDCADYSVLESDGPVMITIHRKGDIRAGGHVSLTTVDKTASSTDLDYTIFDMRVEFDPNQSFEIVEIPINPDLIVEGDEQFQVYLHDPDTAEALGDMQKAIVTIYNDDDDIPDEDNTPGTYKFEKGVYHATESMDSITITILRVGSIVPNSVGSVEISTKDLNDNILLTAEDGTDFIGFQDILIDYEVNDGSEDYTISLADGVDVDKQEYFEVCLANPVLGNIDAPVCAIIYIEDDDSFYGFDKPVYHVKEDSSVLVDIVRNGCLKLEGSTEISSSDITATEDADYEGITNQVIEFDAQQNRQTVTVQTAPPDYRLEGEERFQLCLNNAAGGSIGQYGPIRCTTVIIEDCDSECAFGDPSYTVMEGSRFVNIKVIRRGYLGNIDSVDVVSSQITAIEGLTRDYPPVFHTVVFGANDHPDEMMISFEIEVRDDQLVENTEYFQLELVNAVGCLIGEPCIAEVAIADDDVCYHFQKDHYSVSESENGVILDIIRDGYLGKESQIGIFTRDISTAPNQDYTPLLEELSHDVTFEQDEAFKQVSIRIMDDTTFEVTEEFEVVLASDIRERLCIPNKAVVTIVDDDVNCALDCHNGFCVSPEVCQCLEGYTGILCDEDINECESQPPVCTVTGTYCRNDVGSYECVCTDPELVVVGDMCVRDTKNIIGQLLATEYNDQPIEFVDELYDVTSDEFKFWADILKPELRNAVGGVDGYQDVSLSRLYPTPDGLLGIEYDVTVASSSSVDETDLNDLITENITPDGYFGNSLVSLRVPTDQFSRSTEGVFYATNVTGQPFNPDVFDTNSASFQTFVDEVKPALASNLAELGGFQNVRVKRVFPVGGNIGVEYEVITSSPLKVQELNDFFFSRIGPDGLLGNTDLLLLPYDDSCPAEFCQNGGVCKVLSTVTFACICDAGFTGNQCQETENDDSTVTTGLSNGAIIGVAIGSTIFVLLVILMWVCVYNIRLRRRKRQRNRGPRRGFSRPIIGVTNRNGIAPAFPSLLYM
ncbi:uncharacterized protein [Amphiura filiformis]|uniref:uncharacterized protein n=1 Tax=Amphiura filiformis TaxID=82378 RepID=UPI003B22865A